MLLAVVVVPELRSHEDVLSLHEAFLNGTLDALAGLLLVLVVVCAVEEPVARLDGLKSLLAHLTHISSLSHVVDCIGG